MSEIHFHETLMGAKFYRQTMPGVLEQLERIADALERLAAQGSEPGSEPGDAETGPDDPSRSADSTETEHRIRNPQFIRDEEREK